ncbi:MAG TPA: hypothetical protein VJS67_00370 [Pseudonocardiaceae bacterium]|jgi:lipocalin|nr:hypothetical protein [Pseudonocardiaceae bacterium]
MLGKGTSRQLRETLDAVESARTPLEALAAARRLREAAEALELAAVVEVRRQRGTWTEIGAVYHTSKQGAQQRFRTAVQRARD